MDEHLRPAAKYGESAAALGGNEAVNLRWLATRFGYGFYENMCQEYRLTAGDRKCPYLEMGTISYTVPFPSLSQASFLATVQFPRHLEVTGQV